MNRARWEKELANVHLLKEYFLHYEPSLGMWTLAEGLTRRMGFIKLSQYAHEHRYGVCKEYLKSTYAEVFQKYKALPQMSLNRKISVDAPIWTFWYQGEKNAPYPVEHCLQSIRRNAGNHPVYVLDKDNYTQYVELPDYVLRKFYSREISIAHLSDILRIALLRQYGGIWLDSTFYMTGELQKELYDCSFFSVSQGGKRTWDVAKDLWSLSFLAAGEDNDLIRYCYDLLMAYWEKEDVLIGYLLLDCIIASAFEECPAIESMIRKIPPNNPGIFDFLGPIRNSQVNEEDYRKMMQGTYLHKLTYKKDMYPKIDGKKTFFGRLIED